MDADNLTTIGVGHNFARRRAQANAAPTPPARKRYTTELSVDLIERLKNAVVSLEDSSHDTTMRNFVECSVADYVSTVERALNNGQPFPQRDHEPKQGRPKKSRKERARRLIPAGVLQNKSEEQSSQ